MHHHRTRDIIEVLRWEDLPFRLALRWHWYFEYRAALMKVKYPRHEVDHRWGHMEPSEVQMERMKRNKEIARKRKITELENKLKRMRENWNELFPVEEHPLFKSLKYKLNKYKIGD